MARSSPPASAEPVHALAIVASDGALLKRLPEVLAPNLRTTVVITGPDVVVTPSIHREPVQRVVLGGREDPLSFARSLVARPELLASLPDWVLWGNDMDLIRIARSSLPEELKLRVLPAHTPAGLAILGSKTGLARLVTELGLPSPRGEAAERPSDLARASADVSRPVLVKGERGGGSGRLRAFPDASHLVTGCVPDHWFPVLVQEQVDGVEVAVDALFADGRLIGWLYAEPSGWEAPMGRSTVRDFLDPPTLDFVDTLQHLARAAGLHGFANCSFIRTADGRHLLIEADMRANAWHQFGPVLGVDWGALMADPPTDPARPRLGPGRGRRIHLYPREIVHGIDGPSWSALRPWILRMPGTWDTRNHQDRAVNRAERKEILTEVARLPGRFARRLRSPR